MKLKYYLRGAGLGIIVSTIILLTAFAFSDRSMSDEEIIERAKQLGMVEAETVAVIDPSTLPENKVEATNDEEIDNTLTDSEDVEESIDSENIKDPADSENQKKQADSNSQKEQTDPKTPTTKVINKVPFTISGGDSSNAVAANLAKAGIVDDGKKFSDYLDSNGYDKFIQPGTFYISSGMSYKQVAELLVEKQTNRTTSPED